MKYPNLTIVIPTYARSSRVAECLNDLANCGGVSDVEVIVVDQTSEVAKEAEPPRPEAFCRFVWLRLPTPNVAAARNAGALASTAPIILFIDDDMEVEEHYLRNIVQLFNCYPVDVTSGRYVNRFQGVRGSLEQREIVEWLGAGNLALRRADFMNAKGFDENLYRYNEDAEFSHRLGLAGLRFSIEECLQVIHHNKPIGGTHYHRSIWNGIRTGMRNDLYFYHATGRSVWHLIYVWMRNSRDAARGTWKVKYGSPVGRFVLCFLTFPDALLYAFRPPRYLDTK